MIVEKSRNNRIKMLFKKEFRRIAKLKITREGIVNFFLKLI